MHIRFLSLIYLGMWATYQSQLFADDSDLYSVIEVNSLANQLFTIPDRYTTTQETCVKGSDLKIKDDSDALTKEHKKECRLRLYEKKHHRDKHWRSFPIKSHSDSFQMNRPGTNDFGGKIGSIRVSACPRLWLVACGKSLCQMSDSHGSIWEVNSALATKFELETVKICSSKSQCTASVGNKQIHYTDSNRQKVVPCHSRLEGMSKHDLNLDLRYILERVGKEGQHFYDKQIAFSDEIIDYWSAIQKRSKLNQIIEKIPSRESIISAAKKRKDNVESYQKFLKSFIAELRLYIKNAKDIRKQAITERRSYLNYIKDAHDNIENSELPLIDQFKYVFKFKSDLAKRTQENHFIFAVLDSQIKQESARYDDLIERLESLEKGFDSSPDFAEAIVKVRVTTVKVNKLIEAVSARIAEILENHDYEADQQQKKIDVVLQRVRSNGIDDSVADSLKEANRLHASAEYLQEVNSWFKNLNKEFPVSSYEGLPYLSDRYEHLRELVELEPICQGTLENWMKSGCKTMLNHYIPAVKRQLKAVESNLQLSLQWLQILGVESEEVANIISVNSAERYREVLSRYDFVLRRAEEGVAQ